MRKRSRISWLARIPALAGVVLGWALGGAPAWAEAEEAAADEVAAEESTGPERPEPDDEVVLVLGGAVTSVRFVNDPPPPGIRTLEWDPGAPLASTIRPPAPGASRIRTIEWEPLAPLRSTIRPPAAGTSRIRTIEWEPRRPSRIRVHGPY